MAIGNDKFTYRLEPNKQILPPWWHFKSCSDVAIDSQDRAYALDRGLHPVVVFDRDGNFLSSWGEGMFRFPHSIYVDRDDHVWISDCYIHTVMKFTREGKLLQTLGTPEVPGTTYYGEPFNMPTGAAVSPSGHIYVSDGYGNYRVHKYAPDGKLVHSWGSPGTGPGQFALVHYLDVDQEGRVYVCDRENGRIQVFDENGKYLREWGGLYLPAKIFIRNDIAYVAEQGKTPSSGHIDVFTLDGKLVSQWANDEGEGKDMAGISHGVAVDSRGDVYVAELDPNLYEAFAGIWSEYPSHRAGVGPRFRKFVHVG